MAERLIREASGTRRTRLQSAVYKHSQGKKPGLYKNSKVEVSQPVKKRYKKKDDDEKKKPKKKTKSRKK